LSPAQTIVADSTLRAQSGVAADSSLRAPLTAPRRDTLEARPVARLEIRPTNIYEPLPEGRLRPIYQLANRLHARTRAQTVRTFVLARPGAPFRSEQARESERQLRALDVFEECVVAARSRGDSVDVTVTTRDAWTTSPEFSLERGGNEVFGSFTFTERNLFGRAQAVSLGSGGRPDGTFRRVGFHDPGIAGSRWQAEVSAATGSSGIENTFFLGLPFVSQSAAHSFNVRGRRDRGIARLYQNGAEAARFERTLDEWAVESGWGRMHGREVLRLTATFLARDRFFGVSTLQTGAPLEFAGGEEDLRQRRISVEGSWWRPRFVERTGINRLDGVEDFDLGPSLAVGAGVSNVFLGSSDDEGFANVRAALGVALGRDFGLLRGRWDARFASGPRDGTGELDARWIVQSLHGQTWVLAGYGARGWSPARDYQLIAGGLTGLRAHQVTALAGDRLVRLNLEDRVTLAHDVYHLLSMGVAAFTDVAQVTGPGILDTRWRQDAGFGFRLGLPHSGLNRVARFDVAWPITPERGGWRDVFLSFGSSQAF
jgi:hypothetical protein